MGLLDDAIREHLDLKRARGGDPAEIEKMEREALGPVRREPTIGSTRFEGADEHAPLAPEGGYPDDRDQLLNGGYHDSTAPHPQHGPVHHEHAELEHGYGEPFDSGFEEPEQPKRRFLRRNRPAAPADSGPTEPGFHEDPGIDPHGTLDHDGLLEHYEPVEHHELHEPVEHHELHEPVEHHEPVELHQHHEPLAEHELHEVHEPIAGDEPSATAGEDRAAGPPPHLQFDQPPKRPRFTAEPPGLQPQPAAEPATESHEPAPPAPPASGAAPQQHRAEDEGDVQETTEFDVQKHIAETRFQPDPETQVHRRPEAPERPDAPHPDAADEEEDVLEETPEFLQDTPEHDRLWFEQRPPRDFDFDG